MQSLRERIHERIDKLDDTVLSIVEQTLDDLEHKSYDVDETMALWEQLAEPMSENPQGLTDLLERRPMFGGRSVVFEPDV